MNFVEIIKIIIYKGVLVMIMVVVSCVEEMG